MRSDELKPLLSADCSTLTEESQLTRTRFSELLKQELLSYDEAAVEMYWDKLAQDGLVYRSAVLRESPDTWQELAYLPEDVWNTVYDWAKPALPDPDKHTSYFSKQHRLQVEVDYFPQYQAKRVTYRDDDNKKTTYKWMCCYAKTREHPKSNCSAYLHSLSN